MTNFSINNQALNADIDSKSTLRDTIDLLLKDKNFQEFVLTDITVDGEIYSFDEEKHDFNIPLSALRNVNFHLTSHIDLAFEALESCTGYITNLTKRIHSTVELYQSNKIDQANVEFSHMIDQLDLFIQLISRVHLTLRKYRPSIVDSSENIGKLEIHLLSIMKAVLPAKEKNDTIMLCDLLEYELVDNLTQWKIDVIPQFKNLRSV